VRGSTGEAPESGTGAASLTSDIVATGVVAPSITANK
jgi:hypothetical protein